MSISVILNPLIMVHVAAVIVAEGMKGQIGRRTKPDAQDDAA